MAVLFCSNPVFVIIFAHFILGEAITKYTVATLLISTAGIVAIMNPTNMTGNVLSLVLVLISAVLFALYGVLGAKRSLVHGQRGYLGYHNQGYFKIETLGAL